MSTIEIKFNITDLTSDPLEDYNCNICFENIYKKELYQCKEGHVACSSCWNKIISNNQQCMECRIQIKSISELSRARFIEQQLLRKVIKCPYTYENIHVSMEEILVSDSNNGCKQSITIENLEYHLSICEYKFLKCENIGCGQAIRNNKYIEHQDSCEYKISECQYCSQPFAKNLHLQHYDECPSVLIKCPSCDSNIQRSKLNQHIENECENTIVKCKYFNFGCTQYQIRRKELNQHLIDINHSIEIEKCIEKLNRKISKLNITKNLLLQSKNKYKNKWIIENYSKFSIFSNGLKSPIFKAGDFEFQLELERISVFLPYVKIKLYCLKSIPIQFSSSITLINHLNKNKKIENQFFKGFSELHLATFYEDIMSSLNGWLRIDDSLIFVFKINFYEPENLITTL